MHSRTKKPISASRNTLRNRLIGLVLLLSAIGLSKVTFDQAMGEVFINFPSTPENHATALRFAEKDYRVHQWIGAYYMLSTADRDPQKAIAHYKRAIELNPMYFKHWEELGSAYEVAGNLERAEICYRNMVTLAPNFYQSHWVLANCLLRKGAIDQAIVEFRRYLEINTSNSGYVFDLLSKARNGDLASLIDPLLPATGDARLRFAIFAAGHEQPAIAMKAWNGLDTAQRQAQRQLGQHLVSQLLTIKAYREAREVWNAYLPDQTETALPLTNGSFEHKPEDYLNGFGWWHSNQWGAGALKRSPDGGRAGQAALLIDFSAVRNQPAVKLEQMIGPLSPGQYQLTYYMKAVDFAPPPGAALLLTVGEAELGNEPLPAGTSDWTHRSINFTLSADQPLVRLTISLPTAEGRLDSVKGRLYLDDFTIQQVKEN